MAEHAELAVLLDSGELDYLLELDAPGDDLLTRPLGILVPALVVPFFDPKVDLSWEELLKLLSDAPQEILVADVMALEGFPWWGREVRYLPSPELIQRLREGEGRLGILPLHHRTPQVRVLPLDGIDPRQPLTSLGEYPLARNLYLSRRPKGLLEYRRPAVDKLHLAVPDSYVNPWSGQSVFLAAGDIMLNRDVEKEALKRGWAYLFAETADRIQAADLAFANLESPIGDEGRFINMFQAAPEAVEALAFAGFDLVSLANNHALDYHHEGLLETMRLLREYGIDWVGAGRNLQEARQPLIREVNGVKIGFLSYTEMWFVHAREPISWRATDTEPGVAPAELEFLQEDVEKLREQVNVVVVTVHWGKEYVHTPTQEQKAFARAAVEAGADSVLGHHPHVLQGIEFYRDGVIAYSMGNFVFDLNLAKTWETMLLEFTLSPQGVLDLTIIPAYIFGVQPRIIEGAHRQAVYNQIRSYSLKLSQD